MSKYPGNIITTGADTGYSVYFDGTGDWLTIADNAAFAFGANPFTVECWFYPTLGSTSQYIFDQNPNTASNASFQIWLTNTNTIQASVWSSTTAYTINSTAITLNQWYHAALVRSGANLSLYLNGSRVGTLGTLSTNSINDSTATVRIGVLGDGSNSFPFQGYISDARIVKGTAVYDPTATSINVPTQLQNISGTSLLTCNSPAIVDQSSNAFAITVNGNAAASTFTPFAGYQAYNPALGAATPGIWTVSDALQAAATRQWNMYDPYFNLTTLKLGGNQPGGVTDTNNNVFKDSSSNNFTITRNGNTTQGTFSPFSQTGWSNYFPVDGTTRLLAADAAKYYVGSGDFTIEGFVYIEKWETGGAAPGYSNLIFEKGVFGTGREMRGWFTPTAVELQLNLSATATGSYTTFTGSTTNSLNTWYHFAFVRTGGNLYVFRNGQLLSTTAVSGTVFNTSESMAIGGAADGNGNIQLNGHLSNFRIITGQALATSTFTPPTSPLTTSATGWLSGGYPIVLTGTVGLLTCQSNCFLDTSASPVAITVGAGTPSVQAFSPFQTNVAYTPATIGGSGYFNYSGASYLSITTAATNYYSALGDWTWEAWVYPLSFNGPQYSCPIMASSLDSLMIRAMPTSASSTNLNMYAVNSSNSPILGSSGTSAGTITINQWSHVVLQRRSGQFDMFLNGSRVANDATQTSASIRTTDTNFLVGAGNAGTNPYWNGYISGVRVQNGSAKYTGTTYTIPTAPPSPTGSAICANFTNAGIVDTTGKNVLETVADARISTAVSKFGGSAMLFDGTGDALFEPTNTSYGYGTGDFTIEFWVNLNSLVQQTFVSNLTTSTTTAPHIYYKLNTGVIYYTGVSGTGADRITGSALVTGTWYHIAVCRASGNTRMFINGVQTGSTYADTNNYGTTNPLGVGDYGAPLSGSATMNGYMQDLRITKFARYTTTFTPPTSLLQNQ